MLLAAVAPAGEISGRVSAVPAGDLIEIMQDGKPVLLRVDKIDCPENKQPQGSLARQLTSKLTGGKVVKATITATDRQGRLVGDIMLPDGKNLSEELVSGGMAWVYKTAGNDAKLIDLEKKARETHRGLWADSKAVSPWEFRAAQSAGGAAGGFEDPLDDLAAQKEAAKPNPASSPKPPVVTIIERGNRETPDYVARDYHEPKRKEAAATPAGGSAAGGVMPALGGGMGGGGTGTEQQVWFDPYDKTFDQNKRYYHTRRNCPLLANAASKQQTTVSQANAKKLTLCEECAKWR